MPKRSVYFVVAAVAATIGIVLFEIFKVVKTLGSP